jgi:eukaryotic-like serine/threonine-protein kinase
MKFMYSSGQRPLEGFTLKRGIGRGGFGEVYFAVSDGGKEVAVKLLRDNHEIELRGVAQCLNLKHPNLVNLFDLRLDNHGDHWVVMENVTGESLHVILSRHPEGLPVELAREWFLGLARAVVYLHDHGIVHRDLKPGNVFIENGVVKVGDYGLSKCISGSQRTAQTQSIGTVHYMAPEISSGNYNKSIDIYAAGIILYEMLTGKVPFDGESAGEILMKHLTAPADLSDLPPVFVPIVSRALNKNPVQRYLSMAELAQAVEQTGVRLTVAPAESKTTIEGRSSHPPLASPPPIESPPPVSMGGILGELFGSMVMTVVFGVLATALWAALIQSQSRSDLASVFFLTIAASWAILIPTKFWPRGPEDSLVRRIVMLLIGVLVGVHALWIDGWTPEGGLRERESASSLLVLTREFPVQPSVTEAASYISYFAIVFLALRWWKMTERQRSQRFTLQPILATSFWALLLLFLWNDLGHGAVALVLASGIVQLVSPWTPTPPPTARRLRLRYA